MAFRRKSGGHLAAAQDDFSRLSAGGAEAIPVEDPSEVVAYCDASLREGLCQLGVVLKRPGMPHAKISERGIATHSSVAAETQALMLALDFAAEMGVQRLVVRSDALVAIKVLKLRVDLDPALAKAAGAFERLRFEFVPREHNVQADKASKAELLPLGIAA